MDDDQRYSCEVVREVADLMEEAAHYVPRKRERDYFTGLAAQLHRAAAILATWDPGDRAFDRDSTFVQWPYDIGGGGR